MYLLDSHRATNFSSLPILDIKSHKLVVYIFDAMFYTISNWPRDAPCHGLNGAKDGAGVSEHSAFLKWSPSLAWFCTPPPLRGGFAPLDFKCPPPFIDKGGGARRPYLC